MITLTKSTISARAKDIKRQWRLIDAEGKILGRLTSDISIMIQGKNKPNYSPNLDMGDYIVVVNASKIVLTGKKSREKKYTYYSGYPGGLKEKSFSDLLKNNPAEIIRHAVSGMLPKNKLRARRLTRLYVFPESKHTFVDKFSGEKKQSVVSKK